MKTLKDVIALALDCLSAEELSTIETLINEQRTWRAVGAKQRPLSAERASALSIGIMESYLAVVGDSAPYKLEDAIKPTIDALDCLLSCEWQKFEDAHDACDRAEMDAGDF